MPAQYEEFIFDQGADVAIEFHLVDEDDQPKDLTAYEARAKLKLNYNSDSADTTDFSVVIANPPTDGIVTIGLTGEQTQLLKPTNYVFGLEISFTDSDGDDIRELVTDGRITIEPSVFF